MALDEFLLAVRGAGMGPARLQFVRRAYDALRRDGGGEVFPQQIAQRYDVSRHPAVLAGTLSEEEAALAFLWPWAERDAPISLAQFSERYEWASPYIESDALFGQVMCQAWRLRD